MTALGGVIPVLETPFLDDGAVDRAGFRSVVEHALKSGVGGVMFPGYASESLKLSEGERAELRRDVLELTRDRKEITGVISVGEHATVRAVAEARWAVDLGADAVNVLPPYLLAPPPDAVAAHLEAVLAAVAPVPVVVQFAPAQTGTTLGVDDLARGRAATRPASLNCTASCCPTCPAGCSTSSSSSRSRRRSHCAGGSSRTTTPGRPGAHSTIGI